MVTFEMTDEFFEWDEKFQERFGDGIPTMMIPDEETLEGLIEKIQQCFEANENLLGNFYEWDLDDPETVY